MLTQDAYTRFVECGDPHCFRYWPNKISDTMTHFFGGLVGERDGQDLLRVNSL